MATLAGSVTRIGAGLVAIAAVAMYLTETGPSVNLGYRWILMIKMFIFSVSWMIVTRYGIRNSDRYIAKMSNLLVMVYACLLGIGVLSQERPGILLWINQYLGTGFPLPEKDYGDVCQIFVQDHPSGNPWFNVADRVDIFVVAHSLGWFVKAMILRDVRVAWVCSILFEVIEICFSHLLPNFNECWWDSVIMDVFGCNMIGIYLADYTLKRIGATRFDFLRRATHQRNKSGRGQRKSPSNSGVNGITNYRAIFAAILLILLISLIDLNFFFMKFVFFVPTTHWVSYMRTLIWVLVSIPGAMELYDWSMENGRTIPSPSAARFRMRSLGGSAPENSDFMMFIKACPSCVIGAIGLALEIVSYVNFSNGLFENSSPTPLTTILLIVTIGYAVIWSAVKTLW